MITRAEASGRIRPGDTLIEATSGNTGAQFLYFQGRMCWSCCSAAQKYHGVLQSLDASSKWESLRMFVPSGKKLEPQRTIQYARTVSLVISATASNSLMLVEFKDFKPVSQIATYVCVDLLCSTGRRNHACSSKGRIY